MTDFTGFPGIGKATAIPNLFFSAVLPRLESPAALLAFLWVSMLAQQNKRERRCCTADEVWSHQAAQVSFEQLAGGRNGLDAGLSSCLELRALLAVTVRGPELRQTMYFPNDPISRRTIALARGGEIAIMPGTDVDPIDAPEQRPGIFRLYEEQIGTITPMVADRLVEAEELYPAERIEAAFRRAAERNVRNWRYIESVLRSWTEEGRPNETPQRDSLEDRKRKYLGGSFGHVIKHK